MEARINITPQVCTGISTAVTVTPFYTLKPELPPKSPMLGSSDLLTAYDLGAVYSRYCGAKKMREDLNSFLPQIYGNFNFSQAQDISSLKMLVEKPPITGKEINTLSSTAMSGFRLTPGPVDERLAYTQLYIICDEPERKKHKSDRKEKKKKKDKKKKDKVSIRLFDFILRNYAEKSKWKKYQVVQ
ncbi:unnamed protein product [Heligmosomoides polygyrus]|uniref:Mediator of RNA polymerase II transcription subunit 19 n=1 Tax=Heligmosomoides polygyrus TaxID=6339 RepID=A0A183FIU6_HELPZ|nr:unnamed protein product [Heligmosomoides polygyrus]